MVGARTGRRARHNRFDQRLAVALHAAVNAGTVVVAKYQGAVAAEGLMTLVLAASVWIILRLRVRGQAGSPA